MSWRKSIAPGVSGEDATAEGVMEITLAEIALAAVTVVGYLIGYWWITGRGERQTWEEHRAWRQRRRESSSSPEK